MSDKSLERVAVLQIRFLEWPVTVSFEHSKDDQDQAVTWPSLKAPLQ